MTEEQIKNMLDETDLPVSYDHGDIGTKVPYITYKTNTNNIFADNSVYEEKLQLSIWLYSSFRDRKNEKKLEEILNKNNIAWNRDTTYDSGSKVYISIYETEVI